MLKMPRKFIIGMARCANLFGHQREWPDVMNGPKKDYEALRGDWIRVGETISYATNKYKETRTAT